MKIDRFRTYVVGNPWKNWVFVALDTDDGLTGVGEGTVNAFGRTTEAAIGELAPMVLGMDPRQIETITQKLIRDVYSEGGQIHRSAVTAIEVACYDIVGQALGEPIHTLLGGQCNEKVRAYANGWYGGERTPEAFYTAARGVVERGYTALKFDPFGAAHRIMDRPEEDLSIAIVEAVRDAVGPQVDVLVEAHCRFSPAVALRIADRIAPFQPTWFEEPVAHLQIDALVEVARRSPVPIATGESLTSTQQFAELLSHNAVSILQPEIHHLGGLLNAKKVCAMVDAFYGVVAPHNAQGPISTAMCLQLAGCTPNFFVQELFDEFNVGWEAELVDRPARLEDGYLRIPTEPGLGVKLNLDECEKHPYREGAWLPLFQAGWERREGSGA